MLCALDDEIQSFLQFYADKNYPKIVLITPQSVEFLPNFISKTLFLKYL